MSKKINCWIVTEGLAGTENQCVGVAEALGLDAEIKRISLRQPWTFLSPYFGFEQSWSFCPALAAPWPDLVLSAGRKSIAAARYIKRQNPDSFIAHIQDPRIVLDNFDLVAVPEHDPARGAHVIVTKASPNKITAQKLENAKQHFPQFEELSSPRIAVLIGGSSKAYSMNENITRAFVKQLKGIDATLMITASRRTGAANRSILEAAFKNSKHYFWDGSGDNPYMALLAWADFILVSADSASMLSEACTTGKPVYMIPLDGGHPRIDKLHENLRQSGCLKTFEGKLEHWTYEPLNDAGLVANEIRKRMNL